MSDDPERTAYLLSVLGYALWGHQREQKFWLLVGKLGQNGKGTLMKVVHWLLGDYATWPSSALYMQSKRGEPNARDGNPAFLDLQGIRFAPMSEPGGGHFHDELVKEHSGDDPIRARALYSNDYVEFRPTHTMLFATNDPPKVADIGPAMQRRLRVIRFDEDFRGDREDKNLEQKLKAEAPGILRLLVEAAVEYGRTGDLAPEPAAVLDASRAYIEANNTLAQFLADECVADRRAVTAAGEMYAAYRAWQAGGDDREPMTQHLFGRELGRSYEARQVGPPRTRCYIGIRPRSVLLDDERTDMNASPESPYREG